MKEKIDNPQLEGIKKELFGSFITSQVSVLGRYIYQVNEGKDNTEALMNIYIILKNLRNLTYSVKMREIGNFFNYFENYTDFLIKSGVSSNKKHIILIHQAWNCMMTNLGRLTENPYAELNFIIEDKNIMLELQNIMGKPKKRTMNVITLMDNVELKNCDVISFDKPEDILEAIKKNNYDCLLLDKNPELIKMVNKIDKRLKIIFLSNDKDYQKLFNISKKSNLLLLKDIDSAKLNTCVQSLLAELL